MLLHIVRIHKLPCDFKENARRISVWTAWTEGRGALRNINLLFGDLFLECLFTCEVFGVNRYARPFRVTVGIPCAETVSEEWDKFLNEKRSI